MTSDSGHHMVTRSSDGCGGEITIKPGTEEKTAGKLIEIKGTIKPSIMVRFGCAFGPVPARIMLEFMR